MSRLCSTFAMAAWTGFHFVSALAVASLALPHRITAGLVLAHAALAGWQMAITALFQTRGREAAMEAQALFALAASLALAAASAWSGIGGQEPGLFAAAVAGTLLALRFDRALATDESADGEREVGEAEHRAFMLQAMRLGADMGHSARQAGQNHEGNER